MVFKDLYFAGYAKLSMLHEFALQVLFTLSVYPGNLTPDEIQTINLIM